MAVTVSTAVVFSATLAVLAEVITGSLSFSGLTPIVNVWVLDEPSALVARTVML